MSRFSTRNALGFSRLPAVPMDWTRIYDELHGAGWSPEKTREILHATNVRHGAELFDPSAVTHGGMLASRRLLYPGDGAWQLSWVTETGRSRSFRIDKGAEDLAPFVRAFLQGTASEDEQAELAENFGSLPQFDNIEVATWHAREGVLLQRREHASILVQTETTRVLFDPFSADGVRPIPLDTAPLDAVLVTHSHGDHWDPLSLLRGTRPGTPIYVPHSDGSVLCPTDFLTDARTLGLAPTTARWNETIELGDITIDVLPFYGEQPTREGVRTFEHIRSWGNCFRLQTPDYSMLLLVDSGADPAGSMLDVAKASFAKRGPVDLVLCCAREFACPFFPGLVNYWASLSYADLRILHARHVAGTLPTVTAGIDGIADILVAAGARYFLPYAHGFEGVGVDIQDIGWTGGEGSEARVCEAVRAAIRVRQGETEVIPWRVGDDVSFERSELRLHRPT